MSSLSETLWLNYVKEEYIGTVGCFTSPTLYEYVLNISEGKEKCTYYGYSQLLVGNFVPVFLVGNETTFFDDAKVKNCPIYQ